MTGRCHVAVLPRLFDSHDAARHIVNRLGEVTGEWVIVSWRECLQASPGAVAYLERMLADRGALVAHSHRPSA